MPEIVCRSIEGALEVSQMGRETAGGIYIYIFSFA